ncbi:MAG: hypothetical protein JSV52_01615 [Candidatus Zixiibacteriota bacterium]|nr:MAG: hypothetical protein JSV52_01615 [candidate division Zixibacteria bacterium]
MKKSLILLSALLLLVLNLTAVAQEDIEEIEEVERDVLEIVLFGGVDSPVGKMLEWKDTLGAKVGYDFGFDLGYFITESLVGGLGFRFSEYSIDASEDDNAAGNLKHRSYSPNLYLKYYLLPVSNFSPYAKANVGLTFLKFTTWVENENGDRYRQISYDPATTFGFGGGFFLYTANYGGFFVESNYYLINSKNIEAVYEGDTYLFGDNVSAWDVRGGIRILIGSGE